MVGQMYSKSKRTKCYIMEEKKLKTERFFKSKELIDFVNQKRLRKEDILALYPVGELTVLFYFD